MRELPVGDVRLRHVDAGAPGSGLPLLLIPGHTARLEGYEAMVGPLVAAGHRVLVPDLPGCGGSDKPDVDYTLRYYEDVLVGFLDALGVEGAIPVGGSLGGNLVLRLGHRFAARFPVLVVWAPGGAWRARPLVAAVTQRLPRRVLFWPVVRTQSRYWYSPDYAGRQAALDETFAYYRDVMGPGFLGMYFGIAADQVRHSLFDIAPDVRQPVLLMWGDQDNGAGMGRGVAKLSRLLPDCELHVFPGARHSVEAEIPDLLSATIVEFLARRAAR